MCTNYAPIHRQVLRDIFGIEPPPLEWKAETWPGYLAPIIRANTPAHRDAVLASFGMVPRDRIPAGARKFDSTNARAESIGERPTFSGPWKRGQRCLVPMLCFYEPNYELGPKPVRHRIWLRDEPVLAVAGLWRDWPDGLVSFTMLTVNADKHPLMGRMHAPGKEKRSIVVIPRDEWDDWLSCRDPERARTFLRNYPAEAMDSAPDPLPPRGSGSPRPIASCELDLG
ncbi:SOS response-associated peptidase [Cupriavidus sp. AU9028]|uniref:SOS response-associated peptidase n=1 Tax=Cupriavidus sp. AU9028 TaxID=2871157 RepID=UPI001C982C6A|nr:SOS response-associated peptidase family protein [Cupriavidus sp. AU9028]MBY4898856.1 SOS response-associated peptidase [Cupriavidus sp. AU9028]